MDTWRQGRRLHLEKMREGALDLPLFLARADGMGQRVAGTAVFLHPRTDVVPGAMLHSLKHYKVLHERVVIAAVTVTDTPYVSADRRLSLETLGKGFFALRITHGFFETPDVPAALAHAREQGLDLDSDTTSYFLGRENLVAGHDPRLPHWRVALYMWLASHALSPARFYRLPPGRVVELGTQVTI
ncbi:MAG: potassium transporter Kup, partial [Lysobacteraceae bacterium]